MSKKGEMETSALCIRGFEFATAMLCLSSPADADSSVLLRRFFSQGQNNRVFILPNVCSEGPVYSSYTG